MCTLLVICTVVYYAYVLKNPTILIHEGYFSREYRAHKYSLEMRYHFTNEDGLKPGFNLDSWPKEDIYPEEFQKQIKYRIFYEQKTHIIVKVEVIE